MSFNPLLLGVQLQPPQPQNLRTAEGVGVVGVVDGGTTEGFCARGERGVSPVIAINALRVCDMGIVKALEFATVFRVTRGLRLAAQCGGAPRIITNNRFRIGNGGAVCGC